MSDHTENNETKSDPLQELQLKLMDRNPGAASVLNLILKHRQDAANIFFDIDDMNMRGTQIWVAYKDHCNGDIYKFIDACIARDAEMVATVNNEITDREPVRQHGEQKRVPAVDGAVKEVLANADKAGKLQRMDEGAEYVNAFFIRLITEMQARKRFTSNVKVNLGLESGEWAVVAITLAELLDRDGNPMQYQPSAEQGEKAMEPEKLTESELRELENIEAREAAMAASEDPHYREELERAIRDLDKPGEAA